MKYFWAGPTRVWLCLVIRLFLPTCLYLRNYTPSLFLSPCKEKHITVTLTAKTDILNNMSDYFIPTTLRSAAYNWVNVLYPWHKARSRIPCFHMWFWDQCMLFYKVLYMKNKKLISTRRYLLEKSTWWLFSVTNRFPYFHPVRPERARFEQRGGVSGLAVSSGPLLCILSDLLQWTHQEGGNNSRWLLCLSSLLARITLQIYTELDPEKCFQLLAAGVNLLCWAYWKWTPRTLNKATK